MKFFLLVILLIIATASAKSGMPAPKMRMQKTAAPDLVQKKVIGIRGGGMISRDAFVKFFTVSDLLKRSDSFLTAWRMLFFFFK